MHDDHVTFVACPGSAAEPTWGGERLYLGLAIDGILSLEQAAERRRQHDAAASRAPAA